MRTVPSSPPVTMIRPDGSNATAVTVPSCPWRRRMISPSMTSQRLARFAAVTSQCPSGLKRRLCTAVLCWRARTSSFAGAAPDPGDVVEARRREELPEWRERHGRDPVAVSVSVDASPSSRTITTRHASSRSAVRAVTRRGFRLGAARPQLAPVTGSSECFLPIARPHVSRDRPAEPSRRAEPASCQLGLGDAVPDPDRPVLAP